MNKDKNAMPMSTIYLSRMRTFDNPLCTGFFLEDFREALKKEGKTIADAGTSKEELARLCEEGYRRAAIHYVEDVRSRINPLCDRYYIKDAKEYLDLAHLSLRERIQIEGAIPFLLTGWRDFASQWISLVLGVPNQWRKYSCGESIPEFPGFDLDCVMLDE